MTRYEIIHRMAGFSFYSALNKLIWGLVFLYPAHTFQSATSYTAMAAIADETTWGIFMTVMGILHLYTIFSDRLSLRIAMQCISIGIWLFIATMFAMSNPIGTGMWIYGAQAIIDFITIIFILVFSREKYT